MTIAREDWKLGWLAILDMTGEIGQGENNAFADFGRIEVIIDNAGSGLFR